MESRQIATHAIVFCSLLLAIVIVIVGSNFPGLAYLNLILQAVLVCLLAGVIFILDRILTKLGKRAITPVISVVLLLMMTVAIAGIAWFWLQGMTQQILNATEQTADTQLGRLTFDLDFGSAKVYCSGPNPSDSVTAVSVFVAVNAGANNILQGVILNGNVVEEADFEIVKVGDSLGNGEYKEIKILNGGNKYTAGVLEKADDSADLEVVVRTNIDKEKAIMTFDADAPSSTTCN
ncbi:MAG: archaellin/type IV pilin N-terminal domain-containing protein [archaeon]